LLEHTRNKSRSRNGDRKEVREMSGENW
jgi:hypothetical protein